MSIYDRDYIREDASRHLGGPSGWSVVTWLLVINVAVFVLNNLLFYNPNREIFGLSLGALESFRLWTPITYQFIHASPWHLLGNMLGLFFLGRMLHDMIPPREVLRLYLFGGLGGGFLQLLYNAIAGPDAIIIGASASVLAIVIAVATLIPHRSITLLLFFIIPVTLTMKQIAYLLLAINALTILFSVGASGDGVAVMAHFGGMLTGWMFIRYGFHRPRRFAGKPRATRISRTKNNPGRGKGFGIRVIRDGAETTPRTEATGPSAENRTPFVTSDVDAILDKINENGFQSLTDAERQILQQSSRQLSDRIDRNP
ncbi:MAG: rhomboid family intramembrane serine protease [Verrucomicrobiaceae bacterium]|nr:rhomboid family intramembrane serine protease [Verrucomicrobiaceae bacterium]